MRSAHKEMLAGFLVLVACDDRRPIELPLSGTPIEDCPAEEWCWVRGRPISIYRYQQEDLVYASWPEGDRLAWQEDHWIAVSVSTERTLDLNSVEGEDDLWVRDEEGRTRHWDGEAWRPFTLSRWQSSVDPELDCTHLYRADDDRAWCEREGQIYFASEGEWLATLADPFVDTAAVSLWGSIPPTLWVGGDAVLAWGSGPTDVYRVSRSTGRKLEHYDGQTWTIALDEEVLDLNGSAGEVWVITARGLLRFDGGVFTAIPIPPELAAGEARKIHVIPEGLLVITDGVLLLYDGTWSVLRRVESYQSATEVAGSSLNDLWLIVRGGGRGAAQIERFDGSAWWTFESYAFPSDDLATSDTGETWHLNGRWGVINDSSRSIRSSIRLPPDRFETPDNFEGASLWVGDGAVWAWSPGRALRYALSSD